MSSAISAHRPLSPRPRLRVLPEPERLGDVQDTPNTSPMTQVEATVSAVLVAGEDAARREQMLGELRGLLPEGTPFLEARETWQVLAKAAGSRMVVLTGDLGDISAQGLMRVLSRRHPLLPVISLGSRRHPPGSGSVGAASL